MGSFFYINVPIRQYEVVLRQKSQHITIKRAVKNVAKELLDGMVHLDDLESTHSHDQGHAHELSIEMEGHSTNPTSSRHSDEAKSRVLTIARNLMDNHELVDLYDAVVDGKKARIVISKDSMTVYNVGGIPTKKFIRWKKDHNESDDEEALQSIIDNTFLEKHLEDSLRKFNIVNAKWGFSYDGNFAETNFTVEAEKSEEIIQYMTTLKIGVNYQSSLTVCSAVVFYSEVTEAKKRSGTHLANNDVVEMGVAGEGEDILGTGPKTTFASKFKASIKSRLTVAQVIQTVQANAIMSFDFIVLIIVAGIIAAFGLFEDSSVSIVASMLISPLMGPIMAGCFGAVVHDFKLLKIGIMSELVGLGICIVVGFICGITVQSELASGPWKEVERWPTSEMVERSLVRGMIVGVLVAIPSGAGVALSILAGNSGSLVGVAISASLLPPAVNAGLFWGMSACIAIREKINKRKVTELSCSSLIGPPNESNFYARNHPTVYCKNIIEEYAIMGICSFGLTIINIIIIFLIGAAFLKIKEVAPSTTRKTMKRFWKEDLKVMRDYNRAHGKFDKQALLNELMESNNSANIRKDLAKDPIFSQIRQRGDEPNILDLDAQSRKTVPGDQSTVAPVASTSGSGWFSGFTSFFSKRKSQVPLQSELEQTEVGVQSSDAKVARFRARRKKTSKYVPPSRVRSRPKLEGGSSSATATGPGPASSSKTQN